jgi:hypothetical protein
MVTVARKIGFRSFGHHDIPGSRVRTATIDAAMRRGRSQFGACRVA